MASNKRCLTPYSTSNAAPLQQHATQLIVQSWSLTSWVQQIHKMQNTHHLCRKARTHAPCVFGVCVCVCVCSLLSFWCFYIFPARYWQILSRQLKKHSFMDRRRALPPRRRKQDVAAYPLCHLSPDSFRCIFHRQRTISQLQILA